MQTAIDNCDAARNHEASTTSRANRRAIVRARDVRMQLRLSFEDPPLHPRLKPASLIFVRHPRAQRYILRVLPDGTARVTIPRRGSRK
jgi:hypothetical protein